MSAEFGLTRELLELYLRELAKEYRKRMGKKASAEIVLVGGAAVLLNYGFRDMTNDIDAIVLAPSAIKDAIVAVAGKYNLPDDWINTDFTKTSSFSPKLLQYSSFYQTYSNILEIRTMRAEYLLAMKLVSGRTYKRDQSDIVGIIAAQQEAGAPILFEDVDRAVCELYGSWDDIDKDNKDLLKTALATSDIQALLQRVYDKETSIHHDFLDAVAIGLKPKAFESAEALIAAAKRKKDRE